MIGDNKITIDNCYVDIEFDNKNIKMSDDINLHIDDLRIKNNLLKIHCLLKNTNF